MKGKHVPDFKFILPRSYTINVIGTQSFDLRFTCALVGSP